MLDYNYASGKLVFGRGQHPQKDTHWAKQVEKIERCPLQRSSSGSRDIFGRALTCNCGYRTDKYSKKRQNIPNVKVQRPL